MPYKTWARGQLYGDWKLLVAAVARGPVDD